MKAIVYRRYGSPEELKLEEVECPVAGAGEVLVRVYATSINSWEWDLLTGRPYLFRIAGVFKPRFTIPGADVAGVVCEVGAGVDGFSVGDEVFGDLAGAGWGAMAEYVAAPVARLALKSTKMTFEQAAACPQGGVLALEGLSALGQIQAGEHILINGGGGGSGTFAIQLAKALGATVTAVDSGTKQEVMTMAGADHVLDYAQDDYTRSRCKYDKILDMVLVRSPRAVMRVLKPDAGLAVVGGTPLALLKLALLGRTTGHKMGLVIAKATPENFILLNERFEAGAFVPIIDRTWSLAATADAYRYFGDGLARGKVVVRVRD